MDYNYNRAVLCSIDVCYTLSCKWICTISLGHEFKQIYPEYNGRKFFIAGESYAGKYIPDLAVIIDTYNYVGEGTKIDLRSIIIGNGVIDHRTITHSKYEYIFLAYYILPSISF